MRLLSLGILAVFASAAFAGVTGTTVLTYTIQNNTGAAANDLEVSLEADGTPEVTSSAPFTATPSVSAVDFTAASVGAGDSATFTLEETGNNFDYNPVVSSYYWTVDGTQVGSSEDPIAFYFAPPPSSAFPDDQGAYLYTGDPAIHNYDNLYVTQSGSSVLSTSTSGTVSSASSVDVTNVIDMSAGVLDFGFTDTTLGVTVAGTFTPTVPEPTTMGFCALMLLGTLVAVRRQVRKP
jgi:hypothetical protein